MEHPVVLVHGWGGSFATTWKSSGLCDLLEDVGKTVIGVDLLGHGSAPKPHDPDQYHDLTARVLEAMPPEPVDMVGFSLGAITLLRLAIEHPTRVRRLVLAGIGRNVIEQDHSSFHQSIIDALENHSVDGQGQFEENNIVRLFVQYANQPGNDRRALTAVMKRERPPFTAEQLATVTCQVLVVIGDKDFAGPGEPLVDLLPHAALVTLRNVDHFATTENFGFFDAVLSYLASDRA